MHRHKSGYPFVRDSKLIILVLFIFAAGNNVIQTMVESKINQIKLPLRTKNRLFFVLGNDFFQKSEYHYRSEQGQNQPVRPQG